MLSGQYISKCKHLGIIADKLLVYPNQMKDNKQNKKDNNDKRKCSRDIQQHFFCCIETATKEESNTTSITRMTIYIDWQSNNTIM